MSKQNQYNWVAFYKELANNLLSFKNNRKVLIKKIKSIFEEIDINLPKLEKDNEIVDIDPFTIFGLFNKSSLREDNRIKILTSIADKFEVKAEVPKAFESIPLLNNQNATFYNFVGYRAERDIDDLWELFDTALKYSKDPSLQNRKELSKYFDLTINQKGNANSKITMGLYWISPNTFLNLDSRNEWYIYQSGKLPASVVENLPTVESKIAASKYFEIVEKLTAYLESDESPLKDFKELSFEAWRYSEEVNQQQKATENGQRDENGAALGDEGIDSVHYWIFSPGDGASKWDEFYSNGMMAIGWGQIGDLRKIPSKDEMKKKMKELIDPNRPFKNAAHATWQFAKEMKPGDIIFVKKGMHLLIGRGVVTSDYKYNEKAQDNFKHIREVNWTHIGEWEHPGQAAMKTLTDITSYTPYVEKLNAIFEYDQEDDVIEDEKTYPPYDKEKFLGEVYMDEERYNLLVGLVRNKKNVILQGAPGVGKTFAAKRLAYSMMGVKDPERVMIVQFHQSYSYEDFIEGYRPSSTSTGFEIKKGSFYNFCKKAADDLENEYFFIIDEINRGNLSKIFGELFMLIENDKRGIALQLLYSDEKFFVPKNIYIIGMMNTADRSLSMLDYALRRRFAFFEITPGFDSNGFNSYRMAFKNEKFNRLIDCVEKLNSVIISDDSLGEGFCLGHSYFCNWKEVNDQELFSVVEYELIPLLKEYWFDEPLKVKDWSNHLRSAIK